MRARDLIVSDEDESLEPKKNRPNSSAPLHGSRQQFSYARGRKRAASNFNGMHRRRVNKWTW